MEPCPTGIPHWTAECTALPRGIRAGSSMQVHSFSAAWSGYGGEAEVYSRILLSQTPIRTRRPSHEPPKAHTPARDPSSGPVAPVSNRINQGLIRALVESLKESWEEFRESKPGPASRSATAVANRTSRAHILKRIILIVLRTVIERSGASSSRPCRVPASPPSFSASRYWPASS